MSCVDVRYLTVGQHETLTKRGKFWSSDLGSSEFFLIVLSNDQIYNIVCVNELEAMFTESSDGSVRNC